MNLQDNISCLKGVGKKRAELLAKLNIETIGDLLGFYPRKYEDRRNVQSIMEAPLDTDVLISGKVVSARLSGNPYSKSRLLKVLIEDNTGTVQLLFFNGKYLANYFKTGTEFVFWGKISLKDGVRQMVHPEFHVPGEKSDIRGLIPVYPLTEGITQNQMRAWQAALRDSHVADEAAEWLPEWVVTNYKLCSPGYALANIHFPTQKHNFSEAKYRLIFEELLTLQTGIFYIKNGSRNDAGAVMASKEVSTEAFEKSFRFELTDSQKRVFAQIEKDMEQDKSMNRLVQGDVGSGKTAVAEMAMFKAVKSGFQAAMMAPTEILAKQHFATLKRDFEPFGITVALLSGSSGTKNRREVLESLRTGKTDILIGTHALIQSDVEFTNLGLVITDEQHRFGVNQRALLSGKGKNPDILVMTATPIPRTLAVVLYGDMDISLIDGMPKGRKPVKTFSRDESARGKIYDFVHDKVKSGSQAYVVAPLIEESDKINCRSAEEIFEELSSTYRDIKIGFVHGMMKQDEKDEAMRKFASGETDILVSTVVIEVGIDVANATIMVIENSERFGLAQLHQLRGRVGRGSEQSYCILITDSKSEVARKRNEIMCATTDGFVIAEEDLKLRGPGELFGTRQHGLPELNISDLVRNAEILEKTKEVAAQIIKADPELSAKENTGLKEKVQRMFGERIQLKL